MPRVVLPPADEAGEAETHHVLGTFSMLLTFLIYAVGMFYMLCYDSTNRGPGLPTPWSRTLLVYILKPKPLRLILA